MDHSLYATAEFPVVVYYCKAGIQTGKTIRVLHRGVVHESAGVELVGASASMVHDNSTGKAKRSGARCVLSVTAGLVQFEG